jgi:outer membrane lipoprotein-sorting protein
MIGVKVAMMYQISLFRVHFICLLFTKLFLRRTSMKLFAALCALLILVSNLAYSQGATTPSPREIMDKMVSVYATCHSYADEGEVRTTFIGNSPRTVVRPFSTAYVRPSHFRFEFSDPDVNDRSSHYIVWRDESSIKSWWSIKPETRNFELLSLAIAAATGVSGGSAINVPSMLMSDLGDFHRIQSLSQLKLAGEEEVAGKPAFKIEGRDRQNKLLTIWIDKDRFLILKIHETRKLERFEAEQTTNYRPQINASISPKQLAFNH